MKVEQAQKTYSTAREGKGKTASGAYTEESWEGTWEEMLDYANQRTAAGGDLQTITATVTRKAGGLAECKIRIQPTDGKEDDGGGEDMELPGNSRENPTYSLSVVAIPQPILTHKLAESYAGEKLDALKRLVNGGCMGSKIDISKAGQPVTQKTIESILAGDNSELIKKIKKGVVSFYTPQVTLQVAYKVKDPSAVTYQKCCTIATPPGPFKSPSGKFNWLCLGTSVSGSGKEFEATDNYMLSGPDGWDKDIYTN